MSEHLQPTEIEDQPEQETPEPSAVIDGDEITVIDGPDDIEEN